MQTDAGGEHSKYIILSGYATDADGEHSKYILSGYAIDAD